MVNKKSFSKLEGDSNSEQKFDLFVTMIERWLTR
jgi:hypothetical protein